MEVTALYGMARTEVALVACFEHLLHPALTRFAYHMRHQGTSQADNEGVPDEKRRAVRSHALHGEGDGPAGDGGSGQGSRQRQTCS